MKDTALFKQGQYKLNMARRQLPEMYTLNKQKLEEIRQYLLESHQGLLQRSLFNLEQRKKVEETIREFLVRDGYVGHASERLASSAAKEICGLGPIDELFFDDNVTNIMVNHYDDIWVSYLGESESVKTDLKFEDDEHVRRIATKIAHASSQQISLTNAAPVCYVPGARVSIVIPPISQRGTTLTIRKFSNRLTPIDDMVEHGVLSVEAVHFLEAAMRKGVNIIVAGPVGAGKTTFVRHLVIYLPNGERLLVAENIPELRLSEYYPEKNIVSYATRDSNNDEIQVNLDMLFEKSLRQNMRRFIFGEVLGKEAMTVLEAMHTGHIGITTMHGSSSKDAIERLIMMCLRTERNVSPEYLGKMIARAVDLVIYMEDLKVMEIAEVMGYTDQGVDTRILFERSGGKLHPVHPPSESLGLGEIFVADKQVV